jgi:lysozyme
MNIGWRGIALIKQFESCELVAYRDQGGRWTIGWGHTGIDVYEDLVWTQTQADQALQADVQGAVADVNTLVTVSLTQNEFDALVDFCYNLGGARLRESTLLELLNAGDKKKASLQLPRWDEVDGVPNLGVRRRRIAEQQLFNS